MSDQIAVEVGHGLERSCNFSLRQENVYITQAEIESRERNEPDEISWHPYLPAIESSASQRSENMSAILFTVLRFGFGVFWQPTDRRLK